MRGREMEKSLIRLAKIEDYEDIESLMQQVQDLHIERYCKARIVHRVQEKT